MISHLSYLSDRYPVGFGFAIFGMISVVPGIIVVISALTGLDAAYFIVAYAFAIQLLLCFCPGVLFLRTFFLLCFSAERTIHLMLPFIASIIDFVLLDFLYFANIFSTQAGAGKGVLAAIALGMNSGVVFVYQILGFVGALIVYAIICFIRALRK